MMLKRILSICMAGLLVLGVAGTSTTLVGCKQITSGQTATQQIINETNDPVAIARAAYLDALNNYTKWVEKYVDRYQNYVIMRNVDIHRQIVHLFDKMDNILNTWDAVSQMGITPEKGQQDFADMLESVIDVMLQIDAEIEKQKGEL